MRPVRLHKSLSFALGVAAIAFAVALQSRAEQLPSIPPSVAGHFSLEDLNGRTVTDTDYRGKWLLIYFGYTYCPDVCPTVLNEIGTALNELGPAAGKVQPIFITIDPARDKTSVMKAYLKSFDPRIIGLRGDGEEIEAAAKSFHVYYQPRSLGNGQYTVDHSGFLYLIDPHGKFASLLTASLPGHEIAQELRKQVK
ncbi:MAG TPA: SCO family protein [Rhizomicrobium sp.]|jgi:protein SCO1/2|nr:SCO family protein [Rhizomicrobium sp.]